MRAVAGVAGGLFAHFVPIINPGSFTFVKSMEVVVMIVAGGLIRAVLMARDRFATQALALLAHAAPSLQQARWWRDSWPGSLRRLWQLFLRQCCNVFGRQL